MKKRRSTEKSAGYRLNAVRFRALSTFVGDFDVGLQPTQLKKLYPKLKQFLLLSTLLITAPALSQGEGNIWYFGNKAGLTFNGGDPVAITNGQLNTIEGCSGISDAQGNLQFYTNGVKVWNKNHVVMDNGNGLFGDPSSSQSAVVVRKPSSNSVYYIFTTNSFESNGGFRYSVVNMSANGGLGAVTDKNVLISASTTEKITAVRHQNGTDLWIITHLWGGNGFSAHLLSNSGLSANPVISNVGYMLLADPDHTNAIGYMKASPDGTKLAVCHTYVNKAELFAFNTSTGAVSNAKTVTSSGLQPYGVEFSPNGDWLYVSSIEPKKILRYNVMANDVEASETTISTPATLVGALQIGPDGRIYVAMAETPKLSVIHNPDNSGQGCNVALNSIDLGGRICMLGLPSFNQSLFNTSIGIVKTCLGDATQFSLQSAYTLQTAFWDFGDGNTSTQISPTHTYAQPGNYTVTVTAGNNLFTVSRSKNFDVSVPPIAHPIPNQGVCVKGTELYYLEKHNAQLLASQPASQMRISYYLTLADAEQDLNELPWIISIQSGTLDIYGRVSSLITGCYDITYFTITADGAPVVESPSDFIKCDYPFDGIADFDLTEKDDELLEGLVGSFIVTYHKTHDDAQDGTNAILGTYQNQLPVQGLYARITNAVTGCYSTTKLKLVVKKCTTVYTFPTFFTPNGDGYNDTWKLDDAPEGAKIQVFNRYGKLLYEITGDKAWDGTFGGQQLPSDDYWYVMSAPGMEELRGHFALKR